MSFRIRVIVEPENPADFEGDHNVYTTRLPISFRTIHEAGDYCRGISKAVLVASEANDVEKERRR